MRTLFSAVWLILAAHVGTLAFAAAPLRVCLVSGSLEYRSNETLAEFQTFLESRYEAVCSRAFQQGTDDEHLPGLEQLDQCDVALLFTRRLRLQGDELEQLRRYCLAGKPIVGVRTASHAVQTWLELDKLVFGGDYSGHYGAGAPVKVEATDAGRNHPIWAGCRVFTSPGSLYKNPHLAEDTTVLLTGAMGDERQPIAWTREFRGARIFYTSLGHPDDFAQADFRRMLAQALFWSVRRAPQERTTP